ncbi:MAG TPA: hypothetical protein VHZ32_11275, partial [Rhizomicrobium sp.]|nr:hypothetical protein [Rhizomicrobium sp.]
MISFDRVINPVCLRPVISAPWVESAENISNFKSMTLTGVSRAGAFSSRQIHVTGRYVALQH